MARRNENECAYCAEEMTSSLVGRDWKVYCSTRCAEAGEEISRREAEQLRQLISRHYQSGRSEIPPGLIESRESRLSN